MFHEGTLNKLAETPSSSLIPPWMALRSFLSTSMLISTSTCLQSSLC